ncbi:PspC domain-containing protein [Hoylesella timonensis]|uniref:PspC family transcriptional regulator n=1 Tax=Hoylesella timonensis TaxID=386414 RepID=A0A2N6Q2T1_9BACT|nr:PspC domain-containing protein [Hoylesella timonensis]PMC07310.1 PspC family transcriptional regulator [Hoylesella timonensis]
MKKNITINMLGRLYAIDEDAYGLLQQYIDTLRSYFAHKPDGKEIADDIEARIAELFDDLKAQGVEAINIQHVQDIITRIGDPKEMDEDEPKEEETAEQDEEQSEETSTVNRLKEEIVAYFDRLRKSGKRLYRDPSDKKITGLLAGCARYFGGDPLWWRLACVLLVFITFNTSLSSGMLTPFTWTPLWLVLIYFMISIITPVAQNPEDRLKMKGKDVTPQSLAQEVTEEHVQADIPQFRQSGAIGCVGGFFKIILLLMKGFLILVCIFAGLVLVTLLAALIVLLTMPDLFGDIEFATLYSSAVSPTLSVVCVVSMAGVLFIPLYCGIHSILSNTKKLLPMGTPQRLMWAGVWTASLIVAIVSGIAIGARISIAEEKQDNMRHEAYIKANTHNGVFINKTDWDFLNQGGWYLLVAPSNREDHYTSDGEYYTGNQNVRYLDGYSDWGLNYQVEREKTDVAPGTYTLSVVARTNGKGAYVYAIADGRKYMVEIPANGNTSGNIWAEAKRRLSVADSLSSNPDETYYQNIVEANDGNGYGWNRVEIKNIRSTKGSVRYGISTKSSFTGTTFAGQWVSAADFNLK